MDLVVSIWGDPRFVDATRYMWRSWKSIYPGPSKLHVSYPARFNWAKSLGEEEDVCLYPQVVPHHKCNLRWFLLPSNLPLDRNYLLTEADMAFFKPPPNEITNQIHVLNCKGRTCARAAHIVLDGPSYHSLSVVLKTLSIVEVISPSRDEFFETMYMDPIHHPSSSDEVILHQAIHIAKLSLGFNWVQMPNWNWYGNDAIVQEDGNICKWMENKAINKIEGEKDHVSLAAKIFPDTGVVHLRQAEIIYPKKDGKPYEDPH